MFVMAIMGGLLLAGLVATVRWGAAAYRPWPPAPADSDATDEGETYQRPSVRTSALRYLRGVAVALAGGFWAGALVTGPAVRLVMRLLAVTAGGEAQGRITEAQEVVGDIDPGGTLGLYLFGGIFPGMLSGALYVVLRRTLPPGRLGGVLFGGLHLVVAATRVDPLRPGNPDFDIVGPGWLSVLTFGLAAVLHGMAVAAFAHRYSARFPPARVSPGARVPVVLPLIPPVLLLVPAVFLLVLLAAGLVLTVAASQIPPLLRALNSRGALLAARLALGALVVVALPGTVADLADVIFRG